MADRYWVGGTGSWNSTSRWSTTSGGASGASVPTSVDNVFFDTNSGTGHFTVTVTTNATNIHAGVYNLVTTVNDCNSSAGTTTVIINQPPSIKATSPP
jgi:hypothetical protein